MKNSSHINIRHCSIVGCLVGLVVVPMLLGASDAGPKANKNRRKQIETMTQAQRDRLRYNFDTFQSLSKEQQNQYRQLHQTVDRNHRLRSTMLAYHNWLQTIDPWQREELRRESDSAKRLELVKLYKREQRTDESWRKGSLIVGLGQHFSRMMHDLPRLNRKDLAAVMQVIEDALPLNPEMRNRLNSRQGLARHISLIEIAIQQTTPTQRFGPARWPNTELAQKMIDSISDPDIQKKLKSRSNPEMQRQALAGLVVRGLFSEAQQRFARYQPNGNQIRDLLMQLDGRERDEIMRLPPDEARRKLTMMYFNRHREKFPQEFAALRRLMQRIFPRRGNRPQGFDRDRPGNKNGGRGLPGKKADQPRPRRRPFKNDQPSKERRKTR